jgi:superfamily I DNA and/or RNA helicase
VFIDEAGQCTEPEAIVPISGLCYRLGGGERSNTRMTSHIVIVGDPYQLGAVVKSSMAKKYGYGEL